MRFRRFAAVVILAAAIPALGMADVKIVTKQHVDAFTVMGHTSPARDTTTTTWITKDKMRVESPKNVIIVRLDQKKMYIVEGGGKVYSVIQLPIDLNKLLPAGMAGPMLAMMKMSVTVKPGTETKKVGKWMARRWDVTMHSSMATVHQVQWVTKDIKLDLAAFKRMSNAMIELQPGMADAVHELEKIDGFPVAEDTQTQMAMGSSAKMTSHTEVVSVTNEPAPPGTYAPPANAKARPFNMMEMMRKGH